MIHPDTVFIVDGLGYDIPAETSAYDKGLAYNKFMKGVLESWDHPVEMRHPSF